jgi:hypothetical protein
MTVDTSPENVARMLKRLRGTPLYGGHGEASDAPDEAADMLEALAARLAEVEASIRWVDEVYPARIEAGGAGIEITWAEFNAMQRAAGVREDKRIGDQEGKASHNHRLRVARNEALARAEAAEAREAKLRQAAQALIDDVRRRYPGEELRCEYMRALDTAIQGEKP